MNKTFSIIGPQYAAPPYLRLSTLSVMSPPASRELGVMGGFVFVGLEGLCGEIARPVLWSCDPFDPVPNLG